MENLNGAKILIVDDEESIRKLLSTRLTREGFETEVANDGMEAIKKMTSFEPNAVFSDIKMPNMDGFQFLKRAKEFQIPVIMITGHGDKECAVQAIHEGAFDYLEKPFDMETLTETAKKAVAKNFEDKEKKRLLEINTKILQQEASKNFDSEILIGSSVHIKTLKEMIHNIAESFQGQANPVVLITGESGVGKEVVARYFHEAFFKGDVKNPFVAVNCAAFPDQLLESELFGYEKGAFTGAVSRKIGLFELAARGTIFLDEIGEMDMKMQAKLLRVLQERKLRRVGGISDITISANIITATNRDMLKCVAEKTFREDLFYRINTVPISVAPLRSRMEDVEPLAKFFLKKANLNCGKKITEFSLSAIRALKAYSWPGNVRELKSVIERAVILEKGPALQLTHLRHEHLNVVKAQTEGGHNIEAPEVSNAHNVVPFVAPKQSDSDSSGIFEGRIEKWIPKILDKGFTEVRGELDDQFVQSVLEKFLVTEEGNVSSISRLLKIDRANLLRLMKRFRIMPELYRQKKAS